MERKDTLDLYRCKERPASEQMYCGDYGSELLFKARTRSLHLNARTHRWNDNRSKECRRCAMRADETVEHFMMECGHYSSERTTFIEDIRREMGEVRWTELLVNGLLLPEVLGFGQGDRRLMERTKRFLVEIWRKRSLESRPAASMAAVQ